MRRVGVINLNFTYNYGAVLQCTALCTAIRRLGLEPLVINYRPKYVTVMQHVFVNPFLYSSLRVKDLGFPKSSYIYCKAFAACLKNNILHNKQRRWMNSVFPAYRGQQFSLTREYKTVKELREDPPKMDAYVCGSDQIWKFSITEKRPDLAYFLKFGENNVRKIAYGASADRGILNLPDEEAVNLLSDFHSVSLRENTILEELKKKTGRTDITQVLDPTLLLTAEEYSQWEEPVEDERYVFCYIASNIRRKGIAETIKSISTTMGLPVKYINVNDFGCKDFHDFEELRGKTPGQFLSYIKNAAFVVTDSFHALAFSLVYHKQFAVILGTTDRPDRLIETTERFGMGDRCINRGNDAKHLASLSNNFDLFDASIESLRTESIEFLRRALYD